MGVENESDAEKRAYKSEIRSATPQGSAKKLWRKRFKNGNPAETAKGEHRGIGGGQVLFGTKMNESKTYGKTAPGAQRNQNAHRKKTNWTTAIKNTKRTPINPSQPIPQSQYRTTQGNASKE